MDFDKYLNTFSNDFMNLCQLSCKYTVKHGYSPISISTMTFVVTTSCGNINMENVVNNFDSCKTFDCSLKKKGRNEEPTVTKRGKVKKNFYNQATLTFKDITTKSIKIFTNGKLQMTGITSLIEGIRVAKKVCHIIQKCTGVNVSIKDINVAMINSDFCIRRSVNLPILRSCIKGIPNIYSSYDPDTYPGLKIKCDGVSVFVFSTGSVVITGSNDLAKLYNTYDTMFNIFENFQQVLGKPTQEKKRRIPYVDGYPKTMIDCCTKKYSD